MLIYNVGDKMLDYFDENYIPNERWSYIENSPYHYISDYGRIFSTHTGKILSEIDNGNGYKTIRIRNNKNGRYKHHYLHRLVAKYFICDNADNNMQVNHIDRNRANNHFSNLEWVTPKQNRAHSYKQCQMGVLANINKLRGVDWHEGDHLYRVTMRINGKKYYLKGFKSKNNAYHCYHATFTEWWGFEPFDKRLMPDD